MSLLMDVLTIAQGGKASNDGNQTTKSAKGRGAADRRGGSSRVSFYQRGNFISNSCKVWCLTTVLDTRTQTMVSR